MPGHHRKNSKNCHAPGLSSRNVPKFARAARIGLVLGRVCTGLVRIISEEVYGASSMTWLSLECIVLLFSRLPQGPVCTAGAFELFLDFLILGSGYTHELVAFDR